MRDIVFEPSDDRWEIKWCGWNTNNPKMREGCMVGPMVASVPLSHSGQVQWVLGFSPDPHIFGMNGRDLKMRRRILKGEKGREAKRQRKGGPMVVDLCRSTVQIFSGPKRREMQYKQRKGFLHGGLCF